MEFTINVSVDDIRTDRRNNYESGGGEVEQHIEVDVSASAIVERKDRSRATHKAGLSHARFTSGTQLDKDQAIKEALTIAVDRVLMALRDNNEFSS